MKKNLQEPQQGKQNVQSGMCKYFKVFYSKDVNKKKKIFSEGVLAWQNKKIRLFNTEGQVLIQVHQKNEPQVNEEYVIGYKFAVFMDSEIDKEIFTSGRVFIALLDGTLQPMEATNNTATNKNQAPKKVDKKQKKQKQLQQKQTSVSNSNSVQLLQNNPSNKDSVDLQNGLVIQNIIFSKLREHQIEGVQFMYNCLMGYKSPSICGCILADFMGLGKTLQTITLIYSLLKMKKVSKCIVISPLTLVYVWQKQCKKWLDSKLSPLIALGDGQEVKNICKQFANNQYRMLVLSYEGFYRFIDILDKKCDLIVFDEGHRLKNKNSKVYKKIINFSCRKRVLLTGTPLQNNLQELYTCISIVNPSLFASQQLFNNVFQKPILNGMAKKASQIQRRIAIERTVQLANKIKQFSLRRKADTLQKYLPIKREYFVLFKLTPLQKLWYEKLLKRKQSESDVLGFLNLFRKLFTHPQILKNDRLDKYDTAEFIEDSLQQVSHKLNFVLDVCKKAVEKDEKVIVVSYFTSTLDFIGKILRENEISCVKLDGKVDGKDRQVVVNSFEKEKSVLLLSGKAGGTGLTLVSARTMIIIEPDWNPSNDAQVIGRVWRQGQTQQVAIYRLVIISSFEQRIVERQQLKTALSQKLIDENKTTMSGYDFMDMKKLFVHSSEKSIFFKESQNILDKVYSSSGLRWDGAVLVACKMSHNQQNTKENLTVKQNKPAKIEPKDDSNQFADGMLLFQGLAEQLEESVQKGKDDNDDQKKDIEKQVDSEFQQAKLKAEMQKKQRKLKNHQTELEIFQQVVNESSILPKKRVSLTYQQEAQSKQIIFAKQVEQKQNHTQQPPKNQQSKKPIKKVKKLKKYQIVDFDEYKKFNPSKKKKANGKNEQNYDDQQKTQLEQSKKKVSLRKSKHNKNQKSLINTHNLDQTLSTIKVTPNNVQEQQQQHSNLSKNNKPKPQQKLMPIHPTSESTISNSHTLNSSTVSSELTSNQEDQNADNKSKKGNSLVLNKIKLKKAKNN